MIHVVQPGDTLWSLARQYGTTVARITRLNQIPDPDVLVAGQALLLPSAPRTGPWQKRIDGYAYPFISPYVLNETLPYLTLLSVFSYGFTPEGTLLPSPLADQWMTDRAKAYGVPAALVLTPFGPEGNFSNYLISRLLADPEAQRKLLAQIANTMEEKGYSELNIDFEFILAEDRDKFTAFVQLAADTLTQPVTVCLAPKSSAAQRGALVDGKDYRALGAAADRVLVMTYEWGYKYGPPLAVAPIEQVRRVIEYVLTEIPAEKILLGLANYGYDWPLPYERNRTVARTIGSIEAVQIARREKTNIIFDWETKSPWFQYTRRGVRHVVWFEDVRSWQYKCDLVKEYGLAGVGIWTVMNLNRPGLTLLEENFRAEA